MRGGPSAGGDLYDVPVLQKEDGIPIDVEPLNSVSPWSAR